MEDLLNLAWAILPIPGLVVTAILFTKVRRVLRDQDAQDHDEIYDIAYRDFRREAFRMTKQLICAIAIWVVVIFPPESAIVSWRLVVRNFALSAISILLMINSILDLNWRGRFKRRFADKWMNTKR